MEKGNGSAGEGLQDDCADQWDRNREPSQTCAQVAFIIRADDAGGLAKEAMGFAGWIHGGDGRLIARFRAFANVEAARWV